MTELLMLETATKVETEFKVLPRSQAPEAPEVEEISGDRKINIHSITFKKASSVITKSENSLYGKDKGKFEVFHPDDSRLKFIISNLYLAILEASFLNDWWIGAELQSITIESYSVELEEAQITASLELKHPDGDRYRILSLTSGDISFPTGQITPIIEEAIALILAKPRYEQTELLGE